MKKTIWIQRQSLASMPCVRHPERTQRLVSYLGAAGCASLRHLSVIAISSTVCLASLWLTAAIAQAQESPSDKSGLTVTRTADVGPSIARIEASYPVVSMVDRRELEPSAPPNSATQFTSPPLTDQRKAEKVLLPSSPRDAELASLAALASAPSSSLPHSTQAKVTGQADSPSPAGDNKSFVYKFGKLNFVINGLPNSFSVSSAGSNAAFGR